MKPEEFVTYGGFRDTLTTFIAGYDDLCKLIRGYMMKNYAMKMCSVKRLERTELEMPHCSSRSGSCKN